jgi:hypothetical protein
VKEIIDEAVVKSKKLKEAMIRARWKDITGDVFLKSMPIYIKGESLHVLVDSSVILQHMNMSKKKYLEKIDEILKAPYIKDIVFKVGNIPLAEYFNYDEEGEICEREVELSSEEYRIIEKNIENIEDNEIRERLRSLKIESLKREKFLLENDYRYCSECGTLNKNPGNLCTICQNKHHVEREDFLLGLFNENPYTSFENSKKLINGLSREEYEKCKEKKLDKIYMTAEFYIKDWNIGAAHAKLMDYFRLETGETEVKRLSEKANNLIELIKEKSKRR